MVGKGARIPTGLRIGRNCLIAADVMERDFTLPVEQRPRGSELPSGETVDVGSVRQVLDSVLTAASPPSSPGRRSATRCRSTTPLLVGERATRCRDFRRVLIVGAGKASAPMAAAVEDMRRAMHLPVEGVVNVRYGHAAPTRHVRIAEAVHPMPDRRASRPRARSWLLVGDEQRPGTVRDLGRRLGAAHAPEPRACTGRLAPDHRRVAALRRDDPRDQHGAQAPGSGQRRRTGASGGASACVTLVLSDVVGNPLDAIASGPTVARTTTWADAATVSSGSACGTGAGVVRHALSGGLAGELPDTPKPGDPFRARTR